MLLQVLSATCRRGRAAVELNLQKQVLEIDFNADELAANSRPCGWRQRRIVSFEFGHLQLKLRQYRDLMGRLLTPPQLDQLIALGKTFTYDVTWECYRLRYCKNMSRESIGEVLAQKGITISDAAISHQYWEGAAYLEALHLKKASEHGKRYRQKGFVLAIDATNEEGSLKLITARDAITSEVLLSRKYESDSAQSYSDLMQRVELHFGRPDVILSDMCRSISKAAATVFTKIPHAICHYHFLRNLGNLMLKEKHHALGRKINKTQIAQKLLVHQKEIADEFKKDHCSKLEILHSLIYWARDYQSGLRGNGLPFDLKWLVFCERLQIMRQTLWEIKNDNPKQHGDFFYRKLTQLCRLLDRVKDQRMFAKLDVHLQDQKELFEKVRHILRPAKDEAAKTELQRQAAALSPKKISAQLKKICKQLNSTIGANTYSKVQVSSALIIIEQINKYRARLCLEVKNQAGQAIELPRTNNTCEYGFRNDKRRIRNRCGKARIKREIDFLPPQATISDNFKSQAWLQTTFEGAMVHTLFHTVPREEIKESLKEMKLQRQVNQPPMKQAKMKDFPKIALKMLDKQTA